MLISSLVCLGRGSHGTPVGVRLTGAQLLLLLLLVGVTCAYGSTVIPEQLDLHSIDDRGPAIDPYWYVDRGVRPIGRFGKRQSSGPSLGFLFRILWDRKVRGLQRVQDSDWLS